MKLSIGSLASLGVALVTAVVIGVMSGIILRAHQRALIAQITRSADQMSETIASSTYYDMLENRRDAVHREILIIGRQQGIERVRLINKVGEVTFSSDEAEIGHALDKNAEACYGCHAAGRPLERLPIHSRARIYRADNGNRVLGMIRPIHNESSCWNADCHAHDREETVLGVLDVNLSLAEADRQVAHDRWQLILLAVLAIAASSLLLWGLSGPVILRPVAALINGTRRVAQGDLSTTIHTTAHNELGDLARAFNDMILRLNEAQRQVTQSDKLASVGRLAAGVAHEINNPLTGVLTYASFLLKRTEGNPEAAADLEVIVRETKRCRDIVRGLLDFARQTPPKRQPTDVNEVVRRSATVVMNQLNLARVKIGFELAPDLAPVQADANQIQQVLVNLLLNAADAIEGQDTAQGGTITMRTMAVAVPPRSYVQIQVEDTGRGIPAEEMSRIFEPFFSTKGTRGTGLGLAVSWGIVEGHGGAIDVESKLGQGTCFTVRLPFQAPESGMQEAGEGSASGSRVPMPDARGKTAPGPTAPIAPRIRAIKAADGRPPADPKGTA
jgi:two-component system NtrC family sensor kinase